MDLNYTRMQALESWVSAQFPAERPVLSVASADASFRRYFRATVGSRSYIVMDAPPAHEDCRPFVAVAGLFAAAGVHVPEILAQNLEEGFLLLSDLGNTTYLSVLTPQTAPALYLDAVAALVKLQQATRPGMLPAYDTAKLQQEMQLFPDWYLGRHLQYSLEAAEAADLAQTFSFLAEAVSAQGQVYVHRDYHSRNLMVATPNPGVLDFQDAVVGPITYDLASLLKDAYIRWDEEQVLDWAIRYWEQARKAGLPVAHDFGGFYQDFEWMGIQRHLKVLGIFARLCHRDGKAGYLQDMPLVFHYLKTATRRYRPFGSLYKLLDTLEQRGLAAGVTL